MNFKPFILCLIAVMSSCDANAYHCPTEVAPIEPPCYYSDYDGGCQITCDSHKYVDLTEIFTMLKHKLPKDTKPFYSLRLKNIPIYKLPINAFGGLQFNYITLENLKNLHHIHVRAFQGTDTIVNTLTIYGSPHITEYVTDDNGSNLFGAIRTLSSLVLLTISGTGVSTLPSSALWGLNNLVQIHMRGNPIESIHSKAFVELPALAWIEIYGSPIERVARHAFPVGTNTNNGRFSITLSAYSMTNQTLAIGAFDSIGRAVNIELKPYPFDYLDENVFDSFLAENPANDILIPQFNRTDTRNDWIRDNYPIVYKHYIEK